MTRVHWIVLWAALLVSAVGACDYIAAKQMPPLSVSAIELCAQRGGIPILDRELFSLAECLSEPSHRRVNYSYGLADSGGTSVMVNTAISIGMGTVYVGR